MLLGPRLEFAPIEGREGGDESDRMEEQRDGPGDLPCGLLHKPLKCCSCCQVTLLLLSSDLDARAKSERYRALFRLPKDEKLDGHTDCTLWTPFNKMHILGQMFVSTNYICFTSKGENLCSLIIPLREVGVRSKWIF